MRHCLSIVSVLFCLLDFFSKALQIILQGQMSHYITVLTSTVLFGIIKQQSVSKCFLKNLYRAGQPHK